MTRYADEGGASIDRPASAAVRYKRQAFRPVHLSNEGHEAADVCCGIGTAVDQKPSSSGFSRRYVVPGRYVDARTGQCIRHRDDAGHGGRKTSSRLALVEGCDDCAAALLGQFQQSSQQTIVRAAEAEVDNVRFLLDREIKGLRQAEAVANG